MAIAHPDDMSSVRDEFAVRKIDLHDLRAALAQGWADYLAKRGDLVFIGFIYAVVVWLAAIYTLRASVLPLLFPLAAGSILLGPAVAGGFYELARRRELGLDARWWHFFDVVRCPAAPSLLTLASILALLFALWIAAAWCTFSITMGPQIFASATAFLHAVLTTREGWEMIIVGNLVGLGFAILTLAISIISFPMLVDKPVGWEVAVRTSLRLAWENPVTVAVWGLIVLGLLVLGSLPALLGLAVILPVLGYATWHLYTRAVVR
jgi:uncharacterized membrane protein